MALIAVSERKLVAQIASRRGAETEQERAAIGALFREEWKRRLDAEAEGDPAAHADELGRYLAARQKRGAACSR